MIDFPKTLSGAIRMAVSDLEACEQDDRFDINMSLWFTRIEDKCHVCLAGSVLAQQTEPHTWPEDLRTSDVDPRLVALNQVRMGYIRKALEIYYPSFIYTGQVQERVYVDGYCTVSASFKMQMLQIAELLESHNL